MIEMTLHAVTVRCETLPEALSLLDRWARMGEITLPPAPREAAARQVTTTTTFSAPPELLPRTPKPAGPTKRNAPGFGTEMRPCGICDEKFEAPVGSRLVTCKGHRLKPGQNLAHERARFQAAKATPAPKATAKTPVDRAAAKGLLARPPIKPTELTKPCSACGDKTRATDLDAKGRCGDCQPIGGKS